MICTMILRSFAPFGSYIHCFDLANGDLISSASFAQSVFLQIRNLRNHLHNCARNTKIYLVSYDRLIAYHGVMLMACQTLAPEESSVHHQCE